MTPDPPGDALGAVVAAMDRLRSPGGCPWDAEQTHRSLAPYAIEEAYEPAEVAQTDMSKRFPEPSGDRMCDVGGEGEDGTGAAETAQAAEAELGRELMALVLRADAAGLDAQAALRAHLRALPERRSGPGPA